jgi:cytochrome b pre-mRNA-processing protein 3
MLRYFFGKKADPAVVALYERAVSQARQPVLYRTFGVADTIDGRFEMVVFHVCPLIDRLRDDSGATLPAGQDLFDTFVKDMEGNLRTIGVGDLSVPKKMKKMGEAFYGRLEAYRRSLDDEAELALALARNVLDDASAAGSDEARGLARYYAAVHAAAAAADDPLAGFAFPDPAPYAPEGAEVPAEAPR